MLGCSCADRVPLDPTVANTASFSPTESPLPLRPSVVFNGAVFAVETVDTPEGREKGLMGREELGSDQGMLFIYELDTLPGFWMKGMLIPLDIVWIDADGVVVKVDREVSPSFANSKSLLYFPPSPIRYVLEIQAGRAASAGISVGSIARFS
ncbi:MAG: hypothetical protein BZY82_04105 [SAR202 cluster bacterium Io17-Chloro-G3]|nr:MAG: hypothetical protein BZY82_04105 [SAR202 cluster bacterium Io17-Chloro-G3]